MTYISKSVLETLLYVEPGTQVNEVLLVANERVGARRWVEERRLIVSIEGEYYAAPFEVGLTEMQETEPFENEPNEVEVHAVRPVEKTVTVFEPA